MNDNRNWTDVMESFKGRIQQQGKIGIYYHITQMLDKWRNVPLNIAVMGRSGVGKSSFIITLGGRYADDEDAAEIDAFHCTDRPKPYRHPDKNIIIWDLPGIGTGSFPNETFLEKVKFQRYDCFIIISDYRFTENVLRLAKDIELESLKNHDRKPIYFVLTKVDNVLLSYKKSHRHRESEDGILKTIKKNIQDELREINFQEMPIYLIDSYEKDKYDFGLLTNRIVLELPAEKRKSMVISFSLFIEKTIDAKEMFFNKRMLRVCIASACCGAVPVPGASAMVNGAILVREASKYREQLSLDDEALKRSAELLHIPLKDLQKRLNLESFGYMLTINGIMTLFTGLAVSEYFNSTAKFAFPIVGSLLSGGVSFCFCRYVLGKFLKSYVNDAKQINKRICDLLKEENP